MPVHRRASRVPVAVLPVLAAAWAPPPAYGRQAYCRAGAAVVRVAPGQAAAECRRFTRLRREGEEGGLPALGRPLPRVLGGRRLPLPQSASEQRVRRQGQDLHLASGSVTASIQTASAAVAPLLAGRVCQQQGRADCPGMLGRLGHAAAACLVVCRCPEVWSSG